MKDELTTKMHGEFLDKEISSKELKIMGVYGAISRGVSIEDALKRYSLSLVDYNKSNLAQLSSMKDQAE